MSREEEVTSGFMALENGFGVMQIKRPEVSWACGKRSEVTGSKILHVTRVGGGPVRT